MARRELRLHGLALESVEVDPLAKSSAEEVARVLVEAARRDPERSLGLERPELASFLTRLRSLAHWRPELELPTLATEELAALLPELAHGLRSLAELERAPLLDHLRARLRRDQLATLEREAPERIEVPSGSKLALVYEPGRAPVLAVRIQELFGWRETPRVAGGRVPVLLHLLAPNYRAQQVTDDLASFWSGAYHEVKKELRRRYPRHAWPEDPLTAEAQRRPQRRRDR